MEGGGAMDGGGSGGGRGSSPGLIIALVHSCSWAVVFVHVCSSSLLCVHFHLQAAAFVCGGWLHSCMFTFVRVQSHLFLSGLE